jgi:heptosyltransferase-2
MAKDMDSARGTLVIAPGWVGDMVMAGCLLRALKRHEPDVPIDVLAPGWVAPIAERFGEVRAVMRSPFGHGDLALRERFRLGRSLAGRYDTAYVLPGSWKSALAPFAAGIARRCGYLREARWGLINDVARIPPAFKRKTAIAYQALVDPQVVSDPVALLRPALTVDAGSREALLRRHGLVAGGFVAFVPGAEFGPAKRWPVRHWIDLAQHLERLGHRVVLFGSPRDAEVGRAIADGRPAILDLTGQTRLEEAIDLLSAAPVAVSNDTGLMHVAAAVGCRVVAVYGSTSPDDTPALSETARFVTLALPCSPCRKRTCPLGHLDCLERLTAATVAEAIAAPVGSPTAAG